MSFIHIRIAEGRMTTGIISAPSPGKWLMRNVMSLSTSSMHHPDFPSLALLLRIDDGNQLRSSGRQQGRMDCDLGDLLLEDPSRSISCDGRIMNSRPQVFTCSGFHPERHKKAAKRRASRPGNRTPISAGHQKRLLKRYIMKKPYTDRCTNWDAYSGED